MDKITEAIAHFSGLFETTLEQARLRKSYEDFRAQQALDGQAAEQALFTVRVNATHDFVGFTPDVPYAPVEPELELAKSWSTLSYTPPWVQIPNVWYSRIEDQDFAELFPARLDHFNLSRTLWIEPPGSVVAFAFQNVRLSDNDYVGAGGHGLSFKPTSDGGSRAEGLLIAATSLAPSFALEGLDSESDFAAFIRLAAEQLDAYSVSPESDAEVFLLKGETLRGIYVNGELVEKTPDYEAYRPPNEKVREAERSSTESITLGGQSGDAPIVPVSTVAPKIAVSEGKLLIDISVELEAGNNTLVNSVVVTNSWLTAPIFATPGDHIEVNAIIQINAWENSASIGSALDSWKLKSNDPTLGLNIANFLRSDPAAEDNAAPPGGGFPKNWAIAEITGDLIILNWIEQFTFLIDNDISILASSGVKTTVSAGLNTVVNDVSIQELGYYYDLIVVGGSIYDANLIHQMNVLVDNDLIGAVNGFQMTGEGSISSGGSLLWNEASIETISGADRFDLLPAHFRKLADSLKDGARNVSDEVLEDAAFAGLGTLRVLYVTGNFINLQYVKQTNILGDSDQVALAMNALKAHPQADWTLATGANTLVNYAGIADVDARGKTYVGGERYSDEILIQAELISSDPMLGARNPDALVNEAVAFLDDAMLAPGDGPGAHHIGPPMPDGGHADVMQTMLA